MSISNGLRLARAVATSRASRRAGSGTIGRILLILVGMMLAASIASTLTVRGPPPIPMTTQGLAFDRAGSPLPAGTPIRTLIDGVDYSNASAVMDAGGNFSVLTAGNLVLNGTTPEPSPTKRGASLGETVMYAASDFTTTADVFQETLPWFPGRTVSQDLHLGSTASTPQPLKIQGIVTLPAQGGAGYLFLCNPTASSVALSDYHLQLDAPGTYYGGNLTLAGTLAPGVGPRLNLTTAFPIVPTGDAVKLVYRNPGGAAASAGGTDIVVDRLEFNATVGGTLDWQPGSTIMGSAPAPGPGEILERSPTCADSNSPSDFQIAREPGLPTPAGPTVSLITPGLGQNVPGGQTFTIRWSMTDNVFVSAYLKVWVNVTYLGTRIALLAGTAGVTSVDWNVPDVGTPGATVTVEVANPFGLHASVSRTFTIAAATPLSVYIAVVVIIVIAVFVVFAYRHASRQETAQTPPPSPPASPQTPSIPVAPPQASAPGPGTKVCPNCHTVVKEGDETCFFCGQAFARPPT